MFNARNWIPHIQNFDQTHHYLRTDYLKGNEGPTNCGCAVLLEFSLEELAIVGNSQCKKLDPPSNCWCSLSLARN